MDFGLPTSSAFQTLLESCGRQFEWKLVPEYRTKGKAAAQVQVDGALLENQGPKPQRGFIIKPSNETRATLGKRPAK